MSDAKVASEPIIADKVIAIVHKEQFYLVGFAPEVKTNTMIAAIHNLYLRGYVKM